jgi:hypothetical protein
VKRIIRFVFIVMLAAIFSNCNSKSLTVVELNLTPQKDTIIEIMPFSEAKKRLATKDHHVLGGCNEKATFDMFSAVCIFY